MRQRRLGRPLHVLLRNVRLAVGDVVAHRVVEQHRLLRHDADLRPQRGQRKIADVDAVHQNASAGDIEKARDEVHQRGLARAAAADDRQHLAGLHLQVDALQHLARIFPTAVAEAHVLKADGVVERRQLARVRSSRVPRPWRP